MGSSAVSHHRNVTHGALRSAWIGYWVTKRGHWWRGGHRSVGVSPSTTLRSVMLHRVEATVRLENVSQPRCAGKVEVFIAALSRYLEADRARWRDHLSMAITVDCRFTSVSTLVRAGHASWP